MRIGTTKEGLRYAVRQRTSSAVAFCALTVSGGTRAEESFPEGTAHFVEHTIFKGTSRRSAAVINGYLDRLGGELNAYTTKEEIVLHATVLKEDLGKAAGLLMELALEAVFPEKEVEMERGVIIDEIQSYKDSPADDIYDHFESMLFAGHPLSRLILGSVRSVRKIRREHLLAYYQKCFHYDNMVLTLVGPQSEKQLEALACRLSAQWAAISAGRSPQGMRPLPPAALPVPAAAPFEKRLARRNHQVNCILGGPAPTLGERQERIATILLCNILGGPATNSILNLLLREKHGWVYSVECSYTPYADSGIVCVTFGCEKENLQRCLELIRREMDRLQERELSSVRFRQACRQLLGQLAVSADSGEAQALSMGKSLLVFGTVKSEEEDRQAVLSLTPDILRDCACRLFDASRLSLLIYE